MRKENGVTLTILIITVIIMAIIATASIYTGMKIVNMAKFQTLNTNLLLIQAKVQIISEKAAFEGDDDSLVGTKIDASTRTFWQGKGVDVSERTYMIKQDDLNSMGLNNIEATDEIYYIVDYDDNEIIYVPGYKHGEGLISYTLTAISELDINE